MELRIGAQVVFRREPGLPVDRGRVVARTLGVRSGRDGRLCVIYDIETADGEIIRGIGDLKPDTEHDAISNITLALDA